MIKLAAIACLFFLASCTKKIPDWNNNAERDKLIEHYDKGSLKYKAAMFIVSNAPYHDTWSGEEIDAYRDKVQYLDNSVKRRSSVELDSLWSEVKDFSAVGKRHDEIITADYIINDIDLAFEIWEQCPWKDSISFNVFKEYILPYSVKNEAITPWRKILNEKYSPMIEGIKSPKEAFDKVYTHIVAGYKMGDVAFPYTADPLIVDRSMYGTCDDRSLYIVAVMRSLCIPAAYDFTKIWANYSTVGHVWAIYVGTDGNEVYNVDSYDTVSYKNGRMDGTIWKRQYPFDDRDTGYNVDSLKKVSKIMRRVYGANSKDRSADESNTVDVSKIHGLANSIKIKTDKTLPRKLYLCTFISGGGWSPVDMADNRGGRTIFENLGGDITYLPVYIDESGELQPACNPITVYSGGTKLVRNPDLDDREQVILLRKYLLLTHWVPNRMEAYKGFTFGASDDPDFADTDTLHIVKDYPVGVTYAEVNAKKPYRYVRTKGMRGKRQSFTEIAFYGVDKDRVETKLTGDIISHLLDESRAAEFFDGDYFGGSSTPNTWYWVGLDLGENNEMKVSKIMYCPWNDGNFVEPGDKYELFYYDMGWHSLGRQVAEKEYLVYNEVPKNAILWLRNLTKGSEERIFTYENGKQAWW